MASNGDDSFKIYSLVDTLDGKTSNDMGGSKDIFCRIKLSFSLYRVDVEKRLVLSKALPHWVKNVFVR